MNDDSTADQGTSGDHADAADTAKAKMRAALERKKASEHLTAEGRRNTGQVHGPEVTGGRRMFRRKSGG
ncbi:MAG: DUF5302 domain-containing protein [Beutenbergiaceae bacterium]